MSAPTEQLADLSRIDNPRALSHWLSWAVFLGMSWTWCIGMFLPVLLVRDYGFWGWVVFAIPNVVGAAAMGWVLRSGPSSLQIVQTHRAACKCFSGVTIAFHLFFCLAVIAPLAGSLIPRPVSMEWTLGTVFTASALMYLYITRRPGSERVLAWCALVISVAGMIFVAREVNDIATSQPGRIPPLSMAVSPDLLWLAPVCLFGFLTCPYLDLTFHRARQESNAPRASFGFGFGLFFFLMIIFTLIYARPFTAEAMTRLLAIVVVVHLAIQTCFTLAAHAREIQHDGEYTAVLAGVLTITAWIAYWVLPDGKLIHDLKSGELIYRAFLGFYGLVFPAYVWLIMLPGKGAAIPTQRNLTVLAISVLIAAPLFWMGFIQQHLIWAIPGIAIVLLARLFVSVHLHDQPAIPQATPASL